jgi:hypothetical protein
MQNLKLLIILLTFSIDSIAEECIPESKIQASLNSGVFDSFFKHRVILKEQLDNLELLNIARASLDSDDEDQLTILQLIDQKTNMQLDEIALAATFKVNLDFFLTKKKRILVVMESIRSSRADSKSKVYVDETPLNNLESLFMD